MAYFSRDFQYAIWSRLPVHDGHLLSNSLNIWRLARLRPRPVRQFHYALSLVVLLFRPDLQHNYPNSSPAALVRHLITKRSRGKFQAKAKYGRGMAKLADGQ